MKASPSIAVVVPSWNRHDILHECLKHLHAQTLAPSEYEVIVVDDESDPPITVDASYDNFRLIRRSRGGEVISRNAGIMETQAPIIMCIDDDILLTPSALEDHLCMHRDGPDIHAIQGFVTWDPRLEISLFMRWLEDGGPQFSFNEISLYGPAYYNFYDCHLSLKHSVFSQIGFFDPDLTYGGFDDLEFGFRFFESGLNYIYCPEIIGYHYRPVPTIQGYCDTRMIALGRVYPTYAKKIPAERKNLESIMRELKNTGGIDERSYLYKQSQLLAAVEAEEYNNVSLTQSLRELYQSFTDLAFNYGIWQTSQSSPP